MCFLPFLETLLYLHFIPAENVEQLYKEILYVYRFETRGLLYLQEILRVCCLLWDFIFCTVCLWGGGGIVTLYTLPGTNDSIDIL